MPPRPEFDLAEDAREILRLLRRSGPRSRFEIAEKLDVNPGVVTRYCKEMLSLGLITESGKQPARGRGRPSVPIGLNPFGAYSIGVAVNTGWADVALVNMDGDVLASAAMDFHEESVSEFGVRVSETVAHLRASCRLSRSRFLGFGFGVPGFARGVAERRHTIERLKSWREVDISEQLSTLLDGPVWVENDANAAALAEYYKRPDPETRSLFAIYMGYGVGGGFVSGGQLFSGEYLNAGEIGTLFPLDQARPSALDLLKYLGGEEAHTSTLKSIFELDGVLSEPISEWVQRSACLLERAVIAAIAFLDPAEIVIGGALPTLVLEAVTAQLAEVKWVNALDDRPFASLRASQLEGRSVAIGAALIPTHATVF